MQKNENREQVPQRRKAFSAVAAAGGSVAAMIGPLRNLFDRVRGGAEEPVASSDQQAFALQRYKNTPPTTTPPPGSQPSDTLPPYRAVDDNPQPK